MYCLAEGARGSVTERVIAHYGLRDGFCPPTYSIGLKEVWEVDSSRHRQGRVAHSVGWPVKDFSTYGGSFLYHMESNLVHLGLVIVLDYTNSYLNPYQTFQQWETHEWVSSLLSGGRCVSYGACVLNVGGWQALPRLEFPRGAIVGCAGGFMNLPKIRGSHTAIESGSIAGSVLASGVSDPRESTAYDTAVRESWVGAELNRVRNVKPAIKLGGLLGGMAYAGAILPVFRGREPWTLKWTGRDCERTKPAAVLEPIEYPKPDGKNTFDLLDNLVRTGVKHEHDQPSHLKITHAWIRRAETASSVECAPRSGAP